MLDWKGIACSRMCRSFYCSVMVPRPGTVRGDTPVRYRYDSSCLHKSALGITKEKVLPQP